MLVNLAARITEVSRVLLAFGGLNLVLVNVMLPFLVFVLFTDALAGLPAPAVVVVGAGAWALSGPGVAALFAACRDAHLLRLTESADARRARADRAREVAAIAPSYWREDEDSRIVRPFLRSYGRLVWRALAVSITAGAVIATFVLLALTALRYAPAGGDLAAAVLFAVAAVAAAGGLVALGLVVDLPRARTGAALRTAFQLTARRPAHAAGLLAVLGVYGYTLLFWPLLVLVIGSALLLFFAAHLVQAITRPVVETIAAEERTSPTPGTPASAPAPA